MMDQLVPKALPNECIRPGPMPGWIFHELLVLRALNLWKLTRFALPKILLVVRGIVRRGKLDSFEGVGALVRA